MAATPIRASRTLRTTAVLTALALLVSCKTVEEYLPTLVLAGGAIGTVLALNYYQDNVEYALAAVSVVGTLTTLGLGAADSYVTKRRRERELEELQRMEEEVQAEYDQIERERQQAAGAGGQWGNVAPQPGAAPGSAYGSAAPVPTGAPGPGGAPGPSGSPLATAANPWGERYPADARGDSLAVRDPDAKRIALDVSLLRRAGPSGEEIEELSDDSVLYDGFDDEMPADKLRVFFRPTEQAYVYVVAVDSIGRVQPLFPTAFPDTMNPVPAGRPVLLPSVGDWYGLDTYPGIQHVYFHASPVRLTDLEEQLSSVVDLPPPPPDKVYAVTERTIVETPAVVARGLTGIRPEVQAQITLGEGRARSIRTTRYEALMPGEGVSATRVFEHR